MASSLAGFVIGVIFASIFWVTILYIRLNYQGGLFPSDMVIYLHI